MLNRTMCLSMVLLSSSLLFTIPTMNTKTPLLANNIKETNINKMVHKNNIGLIMNPIEIQFEKDKAESNRIKRLKQQELEKQKKIEEENSKEWHTFVLTYYGLLSSECGKMDGITASGKTISRGMIASPPHLSFGTKIIIDGNKYTVEDRGSSKYIKVNNDGSIRLDVYTPQLNGESDSEYFNRIQSYGVKRVQGYIVK